MCLAVIWLCFCRSAWLARQVWPLVEQVRVEELVQRRIAPVAAQVNKQPALDQNTQTNLEEFARVLDAQCLPHKRGGDITVLRMHVSERATALLVCYLAARHGGAASRGQAEQNRLDACRDL